MTWRTLAAARLRGQHETIRAWEFRFAPIVSEELCAKRGGQAGRSWYLDETYVRVSGHWCYLYRAIDRDGNLLDSMLSHTVTGSLRGASCAVYSMARGRSAPDRPTAAS